HQGLRARALYHRTTQPNPTEDRRLPPGPGAAARERPRPGHEPAQPKRHPMSVPIRRNYHATFILDNRGKQETVDQIVDGVKKEISAVHGEGGVVIASDGYTHG